MKNVEIWVPVITIIGTTIAALYGITQAVTKNLVGIKSHKRARLYKIIEEVKKLNIDKALHDDLINRYEKRIIYESTGLNINPKYYKMIIQCDLLKDYDEKTLKRIHPYFVYENNVIDIELSSSDKRRFIIFLVMSGITLFGSFLCVWLAFEYRNNSFTSFYFIYFCIMAFAYYILTLYMIRRRITPYRKAKKLQAILLEKPSNSNGKTSEKQKI